MIAVAFNSPNDKSCSRLQENGKEDEMRTAKDYSRHACARGTTSRTLYCPSPRARARGENRLFPMTCGPGTWPGEIYPKEMGSTCPKQDSGNQARTNRTQASRTNAWLTPMTHSTPLGISAERGVLVFFKSRCYMIGCR